MKVLDVLKIMNPEELVTVIDNQGEVLVSADTVDRVLAFNDIEKEVRMICNKNVFEIGVNRSYVFGGILLTVV